MGKQNYKKGQQLKFFGERAYLNKMKPHINKAMSDVIIVFVFISFKISIGIVFVLMVIYMIIYGTSLGPTAWLYVPQIIPANVVPFAVVFNWIAASICIILTPIINSALGVDYPMFFLFGGITLFLFIFNYFMVIQTKGLSTQQICDKFRE